MAQEGNILITPFRTAFPQLGDKQKDFFIGSSERPRDFWVRFENGKLNILSQSTNCSNIVIQRREFSGSECLYVLYQPESEGKLLDSKVEIYARDWVELAEHLQPTRSRFFQEPFLNLMRQIGGDPAYADRYILASLGDDDD